MTNQTMYRDDVLTAREVMQENDSARLMWRATWRAMRTWGGPERANAMLLEHHTARVEVRARLVARAYASVYVPRWARLSLKGDVR